MIRRYSLIGLILLSAIWLSCKQDRDPCLQPKTVTLHIGVYKAADTGSLGVDSVLPSAIVGLVDTNVLFYYGANGSKFALTLNPKADSCRWFIIPDSNHVSNVDTMTFYYQPQPHFISEACGFINYYNINSVRCTNYYIDSFQIKDFNISTKANVENVKIFY